MRTLHRGAVLALVAVLFASACSSDDPDTATDDTTEAAGTETTEAEGPDDRSDADEDAGEPGGDAVGVYGDLAVWMCHPDLEDADNVCLDDLDVTVVNADGTTEVREHEVADDPAIDCFYIYPTISADLTPNSDLQPGDGEEILSTSNQAARLNSVCEVWAPVYRQSTLTTMLGGAGDVDREQVRAQAYGDVRDAWQTYLAQSEPGRGVVLIGHSQGAGLLNMLLAEEIETDPESLDRLVSAYLIGSSVTVPEGEVVGGDLAEVPLCTDAGQIGCVVTYATFRATAPPPENSFFGRPRSGEGVAGCVNPAAVDGGAADLEAIFPSASSPWADPATGAEITTPFYSLPGLVSGECVAEGGFSYLRIDLAPDPSDPRTDDISGDLTPEWGLHLVDVNLAMGDIVALVEEQAATYAEG